jgi:hypothetical protein
MPSAQIPKSTLINDAGLLHQRQCDPDIDVPNHFTKFAPDGSETTATVLRSRPGHG